MGKFAYTFLVIVVCAVIAQIVYYFISKRNPSITTFDKMLWRFIFGTAFYALIVIASFVHLPSFSTYTPLADQSTEVMVQELVKNQQRMSMELETFREIISFLLFITGFQVLGILGFVNDLRKERRKFSQPPVNPRPLGLELD